MAPEAQNAADLRVVPNAPGDEPQEALGLLGHARRVADETVGQARAEAEQVLAAAREQAQQLQREARERADHQVAEASREAEQIRHQAHGEAERVLSGARVQVGELQGSLERLRSERQSAVATARTAAAQLLHAADSADGPGSQPG